MHELPITQSIIEIASRHGKQAGATKITDINLLIGQLSSVIDESVEFYWDIISKDTICEGANLHFKRIPATIKCLQCELNFVLTDGVLSSCPNCDSIRVKVVEGLEFQIESIEIED